MAENDLRDRLQRWAEQETARTPPAIQDDLQQRLRSIAQADPAGGVAVDSGATQQFESAMRELPSQFASGANEGLAMIAGLPVDAAAGALNLLANSRGPGFEVTPEGVQAREFRTPFAEPVGGSESLRGLMDPLISEPAETGPGRLARTIGQNVGAGSIPGGLTVRGASQPVRTAALEAASAVSGGGAEQAVVDAGAGPVGQAVAGLMGSGAPIAGSRQIRPAPTGLSADDVRMQRDAAYAAVDASPATLSEPMRDSLLMRLSAQTQGDQLDALLHPRANRALERAEALPAEPRISDVDRLRRFLGDNVAASREPGEAAIGMGMRGQIDEFLDQAGQSGQLGPDGQATVQRLREGRDAARRLYAHDDLEDALRRAENRASTSGTGGNSINATRQNIRRILDSPTLRRGYQPQELEAMQEIVSGTPSINAARTLGRLDPSTGGLSTMFTVGTMATGGSVDGLGGALAGAAPGFAGMAAQSVAESATQRQVDQLRQMILNGQRVPGRGVSDAETRAAIAALIGQGAQISDASQ